MKEFDISGRIDYHYTMGFGIDGESIPDPAGLKLKTSDLDTLGERNIKGEAQRNMVATKHKVELEYRNIEWGMIRKIGNLVKGKEFFEFSFTDPIEGPMNITAYVGDRDVDSVYNPTTNSWIGTLAIHFIEK